MDSFFGEEQSSQQQQNVDSDPTADFLAREQAALGDDHAFVTGGASSVTGAKSTDHAFGADDFETVEHSPSGPPGPGASFASAQIPTSNPASDAGAQQYDSFKSDFPPVEEIEQRKPESARSSNSALHKEPEKESDAVREWRTKHAEAIAERDRKSEEKHREQIEQAKQAIDRFYEEYNEKKQKNFAKNRENETAQAAENASGTVWEKVAREVDAAAQTLSKGAKGPSRERMRQVLSELRKDPNSPGIKA